MTLQVRTPAHISDERTLNFDLAALREMADRAGCRLLYSPKANSQPELLHHIGAYVDGFSCSSPRELSLAEGQRHNGQSLHLVSPLIRQETLVNWGEKIDFLTINSLSQHKILGANIANSTRVGLRVNPQLSFVQDPRYDPCRTNSKLGVPFDFLADAATADGSILDGVSGLHFHSNCDSNNFAELLATTRRLVDVMPHVLERLRWINIGGGYRYARAANTDDFYATIALLQDRFALDVYVEPGAAAVQRSGTIVATVHDIVDYGDTPIAILDTTVNHMPEVLEFEFEPDILGHVEGAPFSYILAGCTCLAGDMFGHYSFDKPLTIGAQVTFLDMGAYTMTKAHEFNGVPLPTAYWRRRSGQLDLLAGRTHENTSALIQGDEHASA